MSVGRPIAWLALATLLVSPAAQAQSAATDYRDEFLGHFQRSTFKITSLVDAVPEELYEWSPGEGVMHVAQVYMHLARYNYLYLHSSLGIETPAGIDLANMESIVDKERVREVWKRSVEHVREHVSRMTEEELTAPVVLYGRQVAGWAVLFQLLSHMNEHVGQSVAYARMNGIVPPWSM